MGRELMPRPASMDRAEATSAAMPAEPPSSCQLRTLGRVPLALASVRNLVIQLALKEEILGPWIWALGSSARTSSNVRAQPASKAPAALVFQVQSGSFHSSKALMLPSPEARTDLTWVSTALSQLLQLTHT